MTQDKQLKRKARELAAETGQSYQAALYQLDPGRAAATQDRPPAVFRHDNQDGLALPWTKLIEYLDEAEASLDDPDPYVRAAAFTSRAHLYHQLYSQTTDPVYAAACARASVCDDITAARIRFEHGIPNIRPGTEAELLGLRTCAWCGRAWQLSTDGACPRCPRMMFGVAPSSRPAAGDQPAGIPVPAECDRGTGHDVPAAVCPGCNGAGLLRVGDDYETETFDCTACEGTGLARPAARG